METLILGKLDELLDKTNENKFSKDGIRFKFLGEGSFGVVYRATGEKDIIVKVMKKPDQEPRKCLKIKQKVFLRSFYIPQVWYSSNVQLEAWIRK